MADNYWQERLAEAQTAITDKSIDDVEKQMRSYYKSAAKKVMKEFEDTYTQILMQQAAGKEVTPALLYKLDSYWEMQGQLKKTLQELGDKEIELLSKSFEENFFKIYETYAANATGAFSTIDSSTAKQLINQIWVADGKSWSSRIWSNTEKLAETLNEELLHCTITGKKTSELRALLQERFNVSYKQADSLVRTEMAHVQTQAAAQRYKDAGITEVEVLADEDELRCEVCAGLHRQRFPINGPMPVPSHPRCRCCIVPVIE